MQHLDAFGTQTFGRKHFDVTHWTQTFGRNAARTEFSREAAKTQGR
jgi:hypothetical protein